MQGKAQNWCFTLFLSLEEVTDTDIQEYGDNLLTLFERLSAKYAIYQWERCPTSNRVHAQGYLRLHARKTFKCIQAVGQTVFPTQGMHWEVARGTAAANVAYCTKPDSRVRDPITFGEPPELHQGARSDLDAVRDKLVAGTPIKEIALEHFGTWCRYRRAFQEFAAMQRPERTWVTGLSIFYGTTGTGKSRDAFARSTSRYTLPRPTGRNGPIWFDGYTGQEVVIIDDFYGWIKLSFLFQMADRYEMDVPIKGSYVPFTPKRIIITSNKHYSTWYNWQKHGKDMWDAFQRRIDELVLYSMTPLGATTTKQTPNFSFESINEINDEDF